MNLRTFVDTSYFYALLDKRDGHHTEAQTLSKQLLTEQAALITSWEIIFETVTLLRSRHSYRAAMVFIQKILPILEIYPTSLKTQKRALKYFEKFSRDHCISLCDVLSYILVKEELKNIKILSFDRDFLHLGLSLFDLPN